MFSQRCPQCREVFHATFCDDASCRRKFVTLAGYSRFHCPLHDPTFEAPEPARVERLRATLGCPRCGANLFGAKPEDQKEPTGRTGGG